MVDRIDGHRRGRAPVSGYQLAEQLYLNATPAGAYYAGCDPRPEPIRHLLFHVLIQPVTPLLEATRIRQWSGSADTDSAIEWLRRAEQMGLLEGRTDPEPAPDLNIERDAPTLLKQLVEDGRALLADDEGFNLARYGFSHEVADEVAALSADIGALHERHAGLLERNLKLGSSAWAVVDVAGNSRLGFWPLYVGKHRFSLVLEGVPCFNGPAFSRLMGVLCRRYFE